MRCGAFCEESAFALIANVARQYCAGSGPKQNMDKLYKTISHQGKHIRVKAQDTFFPVRCQHTNLTGAKEKLKSL